MTLYESLAPLYDQLFSMDPRTPAFLDSLGSVSGKPRKRRLLDAGCATGDHALALAGLGWSATGIDSEPTMIAAAREKARAASLSEGLSFLTADILGIGKGFDAGAFDLVLCLGNTLPHLVDDGAAAFLAQARGLLARGGALVLQTLNFSLPRVGPGFSFPELGALGATMRRSYQAGPKEHPETLRFLVELEKEGRVQKSETLLLPLGPSRIAALLREAGFAEPQHFAGWDGSPFEEERDLYCITIARA